MPRPDDYRPNNEIRSEARDNNIILIAPTKLNPCLIYRDLQNQVLKSSNYRQRMQIAMKNVPTAGHKTSVTPSIDFKAEN